MKWWLSISLWVALFAVEAVAQSDSMIHVKSFPGTTVGELVANAQLTCPADPIPCILVIDASLAAWSTGSMPTLCSNCRLADYRTGTGSGLLGMTRRNERN